MSKIITMEHLNSLIGDKAIGWLDPLNQASEKYEINTIRRVSSWLGQLIVESNKFKNLEENLNYSAERLIEIFPKHFSISEAEQCAYHCTKISNKVYGGRMGNGDYESGDGWSYRGRGLIQITGRTNYDNVSKALDHDFLNKPDDLLIPDYAAMSAGWFWSIRGLNDLADKDFITRITELVNGGLNGLYERIAMTKHVCGVLNA